MLVLRKIATDLLGELEKEGVLNSARMEGVRLFYNKIAEANEAEKAEAAKKDVDNGQVVEDSVNQSPS